MVIRKQYTKEFKLDAISLVLDQGHTPTEVSRNLEINANMLRRWIRETTRVRQLELQVIDF